MSAIGAWLDYIAHRQSLCRTYYGDDPDKKPNDACVWQDDGHQVAGWYESDKHFRMRYELYRKEMT